MGSNELFKFVNCKILKNRRIVVNDYLWVRNGKFVNGESVFFDKREEPHVIVDCQGALISPGLIDIQINGGFGVDFSNYAEDVRNGLKIVAKGLLQFGVTAFCPTLVSSSPEVYKKVSFRRVVGDW